MKGLRVYVAGPMESAGGNWNLPLFDHVAQLLRSQGCEVFSPAEHLRRHHGSVEKIKGFSKEIRKLARKHGLKDEINWIMDHAQVVCLLPGWERSPGAMAERAVALAIGVHVHELDTTLLLDPKAKFDFNPEQADTLVLTKD
jgi:Domain of unknown function (DUF4406)